MERLLILALLVTGGITQTKCDSPDQSLNPIGVDYGTRANNLLPPARVVELLQGTNIGKVRLYDANPGILRAFAGTGFELTVSVSNDELPSLSNRNAARAWVQQNVAAYLPDTRIRTILVGNEVLTARSSSGQQRSLLLLPAMESIHSALVASGLDALVKVTTPHSLAVLSTSFPPSSGEFSSSVPILGILRFLSSTNSTFMVNAYPYVAYRSNPRDVSLAYALFLPNAGVTDPGSGILYSNLFGAMLDAVISAMSRLGYGHLRLGVSETGWPSLGDPNEGGVSSVNAMTYNRNLVYYISSKPGTPLRPKQQIDTYIFSLFNENLKDGPASERNFGLYRPDGSFVYDMGILKSGSVISPPVSVLPPPSSILPPPSSELPPPSPELPPPSSQLPPPSSQLPPPSSQLPPPSSVLPPPSSVRSPPSGQRPPPRGAPWMQPRGTPVWCVAKPNADAAALAAAIDFACGDGGADCSAIQEGGSCYLPNDIASHASYAFNSYYQRHGRNFWNCDFTNNAVVAISDPSYGSCNYPAK